MAAPTLRLVYHLGRRQAGAARRALADGLEIACVTAEPAVLEQVGAGVRVLPAGLLPAFEEAVQVAGGFDFAERAVAARLRRRPGLARALERYADRRAFDRYLCRWCLRDLGGLFALAQLVASPSFAGYDRIEVDRRWPSAPSLEFLADVVREDEDRLSGPLALALGRLSFVACERSPAVRVAATIRALWDAARVWADWLARLRPASGRLPAGPLLLRTYETDWELAGGAGSRLRRVDFVVDGAVISPAEVVVWAEEGVPVSRDVDLAARGYPVFRRSSVTVGPVAFVTRVLPALAAATPTLLRLVAAERWWHAPASRLVSESLLWREVVRRVRPRAMLAYNDVHPAGMARTLALRRAGCVTVAYQHSSSWAFDTHGWVPDFVSGFLVADALVTWGPLHTETFRAHRGEIGEFWEVGCLWSEHARLVREDRAVGLLYGGELERVLGFGLADFEHVVGVFDTSSAPLLLGYDELVAFYRGVAGLAKRLPRVLFLCKPKGPIETLFARGAGGRDAKAALDECANVVVLDEHFETAVPVGLCDLSVDACYTSPAIETIGAGRPAIHYDPTNRFPDAFFRRIPGFVATTDDELAALVEERLATGAADREADLEQRFAELEGHFDGLAITRLRERLRAVLDR